MNRSEGKRRAPLIKSSPESSKGMVLALGVFGFALGIAWPRIAGVSLVPEAPIENDVVAAEEETPQDAVALAQQTEVIELTPEDRLNISPVKITSCESKQGKSTTCDEIAVDELVHSHLISLLGCSSATGVFGTLSLGFVLDFETGKVKKLESGRSTNLPESSTKELLRCAEQDLSGVSLADIPHQYDQYQVFYLLEFKTPEAAADEKSTVVPVSGRATVQWRTALIRKDADQDSQVVARLLSGAVVLVTGRMGDWYRIKYDSKGREGWVHGGAIGLKND